MHGIGIQPLSAELKRRASNLRCGKRWSWWYNSNSTGSPRCVRLGGDTNLRLNIFVYKPCENSRTTRGTTQHILFGYSPLKTWKIIGELCSMNSSSLPACIHCSRLPAHIHCSRRLWNCNCSIHHQ